MSGPDEDLMARFAKLLGRADDLTSAPSPPSIACAHRENDGTVCGLRPRNIRHLQGFANWHHYVPPTPPRGDNP